MNVYFSYSQISLQHGSKSWVCLKGFVDLNVIPKVFLKLYIAAVKITVTVIVAM